MKSQFEYFLKAAKLLYQEPKLWLIYLFFYVLTILFGPMEQSPFAWIFGLIGLIGTYLGVTYGLSSPVFYAEVQSKHHLTLKLVKETLKTNAKRLIWPFISCILLFFLLLILFGTVMGLIFNGSSDKIAESIANLFKSADQPLSLVFLVISILSVPFLFVDVLFSIEKDRFWQAVKKSLILAFKFPRFLLAMLVIRYLVASLINFIPHDPIALSFFKQALTYLLDLWLIGASFLFYQKNLTKKSPH